MRNDENLFVIGMKNVGSRATQCFSGSYCQMPIAK